LTHLPLLRRCEVLLLRLCAPLESSRFTAGRLTGRLKLTLPLLLFLLILALHLFPRITLLLIAY
jgi:hypothetical protein